MKTIGKTSDLLAFWNTKPCLLGAMFPLLLLAQEVPAEPQVNTAWNIILTIIYFFLFFLCVGIILYMIKKGVFSINQDVEIEEMDFEQQLRKQFNSADNDQVGDLKQEKVADMTSENADKKMDIHTLNYQPKSNNETNSSEHPTALVERLIKLRVINSYQGKLDLPLPPNGLIYTMRRGGSCLILPRQESAEMMNYYCRRYTVVFVPCGGDEVLVYGRLQDQLSDLTRENSI